MFVSILINNLFQPNSYSATVTYLLRLAKEIRTSKHSLVITAEDRLSISGEVEDTSSDLKQKDSRYGINMCFYVVMDDNPTYVHFLFKYIYLYNSANNAS